MAKSQVTNDTNKMRSEVKSLVKETIKDESMHVNNQSVPVKMNNSGTTICQSYTQVSSMEYKLNDIYEFRPFACSECPSRFKTNQHLKTHFRLHTGETPYSCSYCGRMFKHLGVRNDHEKAHRGDRQYECPKCDATFVVQTIFAGHLKRIHPDATPYECPHVNCSKKFSRPSFLTRHLKSHGVKEYQCLTCQVEFSQVAHLNIHYRTKKHLKLSGQRNSEIILKETVQHFKCQICSKSYKNQKRLNRHNIRRHISNGSTPTVHESNHDGEILLENEPTSSIKWKINQPPPNDNSFAWSRWENGDGETSMSTNDHECNLCLKSFPTQKRLERHRKKRSHNDKSPHECPVCCENFETIDLLGVHLFLHGPNAL